MGQLIPYRVGDYDMVAAINPDQAIRVLMDYCGDFYGGEELCLDDVEDCSSCLSKMIFDGDGDPTQTLADYINDCNGVPQYLYGWG